MGPAFNPTGNNAAQQNTFWRDYSQQWQLPHNRLPQPQLLGQPLLLSGRTQPRTRVWSSRVVLTFGRVNVLGDVPKGQDSKHSLPLCPTCIKAISPPIEVTQQSANKTGLNTGTSEVSINTLFFSFRCYQPYNPDGICQPALSAGQGESDALGVPLLAPQQIVTISTVEPKHWTSQGSI